MFLLGMMMMIMIMIEMMDEEARKEIGNYRYQ